MTGCFDGIPGLRSETWSTQVLTKARRVDFALNPLKEPPGHAVTSSCKVDSRAAAQSFCRLASDADIKGLW
jgi:hypothetical protein